MLFFFVFLKKQKMVRSYRSDRSVRSYRSDRSVYHCARGRWGVIDTDDHDEPIRTCDYCSDPDFKWIGPATCQVATCTAHSSIAHRDMRAALYQRGVVLWDDLPLSLMKVVEPGYHAELKWSKRRPVWRVPVGGKWRTVTEYARELNETYKQETEAHYKAARHRRFCLHLRTLRTLPVRTLRVRWAQWAVHARGPSIHPFVLIRTRSGTGSEKELVTRYSRLVTRDSLLVTRYSNHLRLRARPLGSLMPPRHGA